jgi:methyl coenzyme M reductase subunit D
MKEWVLENVNGKIKHVEKTTREVFKGKAPLDVQTGDIFEQVDQDGFVKRLKKISHEKTPFGGVVVHAVEVI